MKIFSITTFLLLAVNLLSAQNEEYLKSIVLKCPFQPNSIDINKDNSRLLIGGENKMVVVYDFATKKNIFESEAHYQPVVKVMYSKKHDGFYTVGDKSFKLWLNGAEEPELLFTGSHTYITDLDMTDKEDHFVGGSYEKRFRYWVNTNLSEPQAINTAQKKSVVSVALSNNNKIIAAGSLDSSIELWNTDSLTRMVMILAHASTVCCLDFIQNDKYLLSGSHDGYLKLWDAQSGKNLKVYGGHTKPISTFHVGPNEKYILTAAYDNSIGLYNIATGDRIYRFLHHKAPVLDVKWNADGNGFYSCDKEGIIVEWTVPKKVFVDFYFGQQLNAEMQNSKLFKPKQKGESKDDYKSRLARAKKMEEKLIDTYYQKYLELEKTQVIQ